MDPYHSNQYDMHEPNLDQRVWEVGAQHGQQGGGPGDFPLTRVTVAQDLAHQGACGDTPFSRVMSPMAQHEGAQNVPPPTRDYGAQVVSDHQGLPLQRVMVAQNAHCVLPSTTPSSSSSGYPHWMVRSCRACGDVVAGPSVECSTCHCAVHSHCVVRRVGAPLICTACAAEFDFARSQHIAQQRMMAASVGLGRVAGASGQLLGQAAGAVVTGAVGLAFVFLR